MKASWSYRIILWLAQPLLLLLTKRDWRGGEHLPGDGGVVVVVNHTSYFDPLAVGHFVHAHGRWVRFLGKSELFKLPLLGTFFRNAGQIPVHRGTATAANALRDAVTALQGGACIVIYPEGTTTRDPELWPMAAKTGAARMALTTQVPVIPVAQWGAERVITPKHNKVHLFPRQTMHVHAGQPVDLSDLYGQEQTPAVLEEATDRIMLAITMLLAEIRGEMPPAVRFDPRRRGRSVE